MFTHPKEQPFMPYAIGISALLLFSGVLAYNKSKPHRLSKPQLAPFESKESIIKALALPSDCITEVVQPIRSIHVRFKKNTPQRIFDFLATACAAKDSKTSLTQNGITRSRQNNDEYLITLVTDKKTARTFMTLSSTLLLKLDWFKTFAVDSPNLPETYRKILLNRDVVSYIQSILPQGETIFTSTNKKALIDLKGILGEKIINIPDPSSPSESIYVLKVPSITRFNNVVAKNLKAFPELTESKEEARSTMRRL